MIDPEVRAVFQTKVDESLPSRIGNRFRISAGVQISNPKNHVPSGCALERGRSEGGKIDSWLLAHTDKSSSTDQIRTRDDKSTTL